MPGLVELLRKESLNAVRYAQAGTEHRNYSPPAWRNRAKEGQKRRGWEIAVRIDKMTCAMLNEGHERQVEETMGTLAEGRGSSTEPLTDLEYGDLLSNQG
jgi:hypothetical protein